MCKVRKLFRLCFVCIGLLRKAWSRGFSFFFRIESSLSQTKCHVTSRCSITSALCAYVGQFLSRSFVVLLRKSLPQNYNLKTAAELGVRLTNEKNMRSIFNTGTIS